MTSDRRGHQVLSSVFGIGQDSELVTKFDAALRNKQSYEGYYWFDASGKPCDGDKGTQYVYSWWVWF